MRKIRYIISILLLFAVLVVFISYFFLPQILSATFTKLLKAEVRIDEASLHFKEGITAKGISIRNKKGLACDIESAEIATLPVSLAVRTKKWAVPVHFTLQNVRLSYPKSAVINSIAEGLSIKQPELFKFDTASGKLYFKRKEFIIESLNALGKHINLFIDGTIIEDSRINASFKIFLSGELIASIPENTRKVFFKQDGSWSKVELYLTGSLQRPSINFSTDLFKLIVK